MPSLEITIPLPPRATHPNARPHWRTLAKAKKQQRGDAFLSAKDAIGRSAAPRFVRATILATFYKPGTQAKTMDSDGMVAWLKATADGLQDAQVIVNDSGLTWLPPKELLGAAAGGERKVVLLVSSLDG